MIRRKQLTQAARRRRLGTADNHKQRRHWGKIYVNAGFQQHLFKVDPNGRKHWYYVRSLGMPLRQIVRGGLAIQEKPQVNEVEVLPSPEEYARQIVEHFNIPPPVLGVVVVDEEMRG